jgi:hypothetical protein
MEPKWAEENLQTIRTLMERSALYRRALAPIMIFAGTTGIVSGLVGWFCQIESNREFVWLWLGVAGFTLAGSLLLVRRQALKDSEQFWSPPTRRVGQALLPAFFVGFTLAVLVLAASASNGSIEYDDIINTILVIFWTWFYGFAVHAAGFYMPRGIRWLGWVFVVIGVFLLVCMAIVIEWLMQISPNLLMGGIFGGLHLAYGIYLYFTEKKSPVA